MESSSDESRNLGLWRAVAGGNGGLAGLVSGSHMQAFENAVAGGSRLSCTQLLRTAEQMQEEGNSSVGLWPVLYPQIVTPPLQNAAAGNMFLLQQSVNAANLWRDDNSLPPQMPSAEGLPIPSHVISTQSSPQILNSNKTEVANEGVSVHLLAPVTPDRVGSRRNNSNQSHELPNSSVKGSAEVRQHEQLDVSPRAGSNVPIDQSVYEHFSVPEPRGPSATIWNFSNPFMETQSLEKESLQSINLATPSKESRNCNMIKQQTVEPLTPLRQTRTLQKEDQQGIDLNETPPQKPPRRKKHRPKVITEGRPKKTPQPVTSEHTPKKRNLRSKRDATTPTKIGVEEVDSRKRPRSCRRALNFSFKAHPGDGDRRPAEAVCSKLQFDWDSQNHDQVTCHSLPSIKSNSCGTHGSDVVVPNSTTRIAFDLNHSLNQIVGEYIPLPTNSENQCASNNFSPNARKELNSGNSFPIATRTRSKENIKVLARMKNIRSQVQEAEHCTILPSYSATHTPQWNTLSATYINSQNHFVAEEPHATQTGNGTKCESNKNSVVHPTSLLEPHALSVKTDGKIIQDSSISDLCNKKNSFIHVASSENVDKGNKENDKLHNEVKEQYRDIMTKKKRSKIPSRVRKLSSVVAYGKLFSASHSVSSFYPTEVCFRALLAQNQLKPTKRKRTKSRARSISYSSTVHQMAVATFQNRISFSASDLTSNITEKFKHLSICEGGKDITMTTAEDHALVPYNGNRQIVSHGDPFDIMKKRQRPRPKVDLDKETDRVWRLLMWKEGEEEREMEKVKWWEAERQVFRGRVDSFIARMHRVQGDRRFSPWKGSVVDSVIGVFLTQNVSDHLSSSAFMALAARFPLHSRTRVNQDITNRTPERSEDGILHINESQNKMSNPTVDLEGSTVPQAYKIAVEMETACSTRSFESNMMPNITDYSISKETAKCKNGHDLSHESIVNKLAMPRLFEEILSSKSPAISSTQVSTNLNFQKISQISSSSESNDEAVNPEWKQKNITLNGSGIPSFMKLLQMQGPSFGGGVVGQNVVHQHKHIECQQRGDFATKELDQIDVCQNECGSYMPTASEIRDILSRSKPEKANRVGAYDAPHSEILSSCSEDVSTSSSCSPPGKEPPQVTGSESTNMTKAIAEKTYSESLVNNCKCGQEVTNTNFSMEKSNYKTGVAETTPNRLTPKRQRREANKKKDFDWESLRQETCCKSPRKERPANLRDSLDYEAVRCAEVGEISNTIRERGMNNMLAERIKDFLNRLVREHGGIDLEWLRDVSPDKAKDYLLSIRGLGLKSVECVRLLTLHHLAFPVDTNVGRICVRLGWVPLQPLPESLQLHLLELYPVLESIQKYLWPRLCKLDQHTLYELHYQMITFGKVFCTKSKPNCNACPMRAECRHFASAFASARLALPGPENRSLVMKDTPLATSEQDHEKASNSIPMAQLEMAPHSQAASGITTCQPIIEEPASPEPEHNVDISETEIEDAFWKEDPDEIPTIKLNIEKFSQNVQNYVRESNMNLQGGDLSKALVALTLEAASIPMPKLKNLSRLRTEHYVYELPDSHVLLKGLDPREPDDPCPYLLAIWAPGETAESIEPPQMVCRSQTSEELCENEMCFACNSIREANTQTVRGTLLIPCRTAMKGSFPLNGTYFQVNEVFSDHDSSIEPIDVPRALIWNLPRRTVYFGTSVTTIFRGLTTEGIQQCFWRGFVCVRGFDQKTRSPRPLTARLHFPASKLGARKRGQTQPSE
ncbi:hypothetical protein H6P81_003627 [Aristolochia fimbriata]|uniref:HhH-GPD domain-containing protein n=1 Tax=Aristolochia fimbriata TaxID=158543 RepID=A0AAV7FDP0_ARIFI|nr:hypothetical protein H6P81_003627 [Aristolochia fimbriata]